MDKQNGNNYNCLYIYLYNSLLIFQMFCLASWKIMLSWDSMLWVRWYSLQTWLISILKPSHTNKLFYLIVWYSMQKADECLFWYWDFCPPKNREWFDKQIYISLCLWFYFNVIILDCHKQTPIYWTTTVLPLYILQDCS